MVRVFGFHTVVSTLLEGEDTVVENVSTCHLNNLLASRCALLYIFVFQSHSHGVSLRYHRHQEGGGALWFAAERGHCDIVELLLEKGVVVRPCISYLSLRDCS